MGKSASSYFSFELKEPQKRAFEALQLFTQDPEQKVFILKGYAGTGKTTLLSGLIKWLREQEIEFKLLATTGRAAKILSEKTGTTAGTIHSLIYHFNDLDGDLAQMSEIKSNPQKDDKGHVLLLFNLRQIENLNETIYIIDESSMLSDEPESTGSFARFGSGDLLQDLFDYDAKGKYLFVGDPCQLPPANQLNSPALNATHLKEKYKLSVRETELREIVRQAADNSIIQASFKLRHQIATNPPVKFAQLHVIGYPHISVEPAHVTLLNKYIDHIKENGYQNATMICQTNYHCTQLNSIIRKTIHGKHELTVGDLLMVTQNNYLSDLVNGDQVLVKSIGGTEYRCGLTFQSIEVESLSSGNTYTLPMLTNILYSNKVNLDHKQHRDLLIDFHERMNKLGIKQRSEEFRSKMMDDPYLNALRAVFGYAITCHKSQGGEWQDVYLYMDNKIHGIPKPNIYQWWYTAITRAKENLYITREWYIH